MTVTMTAASSADPPDDAGFRVLRVGASREEEFTAFMRDAAPALGRTAWLLCGDEHLADELVQQALTRTYLSWRKARERDPMAYARRTLANLRIDHWRRRRREVLTAPAELPEGAGGRGRRRAARRA